MDKAQFFHNCAEAYLDSQLAAQGKGLQLHGKEREETIQSILLRFPVEYERRWDAFNAVQQAIDLA